MYVCMCACMRACACMYVCMQPIHKVCGHGGLLTTKEQLTMTRLTSTTNTISLIVMHPQVVPNSFKTILQISVVDPGFGKGKQGGRG